MLSVIRLFGQSFIFTVKKIFLFGFLVIFSVKFAAASEIVVGKVRVHILSSSVVRLETEGPMGFEDRLTFHIVDREIKTTPFTTRQRKDAVLVETEKFIIVVPAQASSLDNIVITDKNGNQLWSYQGLPDNRLFLPAVSDKTVAWALADSPRVVPPAWGYSVAPVGSANAATNGWDFSNDAPDMYVFLPQGDGRRLRQDFLKLTGRTELVPLYALGAWDSRWYAYTEESALRQIDDYRNRDFPLDVLVIDTDWRVGGSTGYEVNTNYFSDIERFLAKLKEENIYTMFNDHPEPKGANLLVPEEVAFRNEGLRGLLNKGVDVWWFDRNWPVTLISPADRINKEVWGMWIYHWITQNERPDRRPMIMANFDGIDNGVWQRAPNLASHRYSIQWTGDNDPSLTSLRREVESAVQAGMFAAFPYLSADLGGHLSDPSEDGYIRWLQYGSLSPIYRPHGTRDLQRMPWAFGGRVEKVARDYIKMRYRLLPLFYALARQSYDNGDPILRRADFDYPEYVESRRNDQYLLDHDILVAPQLDNPVPNYRNVPADWLRTGEGTVGLRGNYFAKEELSGKPVFTRIDREIAFDWGTGSPSNALPTDHFSVRWQGVIVVPDDGDIVLAARVDDGVRVYIDDQPVINDWQPKGATLIEMSGRLSRGSRHKIRIEYYDLINEAVFQLKWRPVDPATDQRQLWLPPGGWYNAWTGQLITGPRIIATALPIEQMPIYLRSGAIIPLAPDMLSTGEKPWDIISLDIYPCDRCSRSFQLYEDDTMSNEYKRGAYRTTKIDVVQSWRKGRINVAIAAAQGSYHASLESRRWVIRLHQPGKMIAPNDFTVKENGYPIGYRVIPQNSQAMLFGHSGAAPDGDLLEIDLAESSVYSERFIQIVEAER